MKLLDSPTLLNLLPGVGVRSAGAGSPDMSVGRQDRRSRDLFESLGQSVQCRAPKMLHDLGITTPGIASAMACSLPSANPHWLCDAQFLVRAPRMVASSSDAGR